MMIFDDHDVHDDWNISAGLARGDARRRSGGAITSSAALASYWVYQHIGNLSPEGHADDELLRKVKEADDGWPILAEFARAADE